MAISLLALGMARGQEPPTRVLIPFDFESEFDSGRYGRMVGDLVWEKLKREGTYILPESMQDVRDWSERTGKVPTASTSLKEMKQIVREEQAGELAIWGKVERVPGNDLDVYDLWIKVADFSVEPPRLIYEKQARTQSVSEIPHLYIKEAIDRLNGRFAVAEKVVRPEPVSPDGVSEGPNLVAGEFEQGRVWPQGWDPLPAHVSWLPADGGQGKLIRFTIPREVAETTGVLYYSDLFPVEEGATYRFKCRWRSTGTAAKVFIKCYDDFESGYQSKGADQASGQKREVYRSQQNLKGEAGAWHEHTEDFTPRHSQYHPSWGRVMLYAYYPAGVVEWDDVEVRLLKLAAGSR